MDPVMIEKLQAMKRYRSSKRSFLRSFMKCTMAMFFTGFFLSCPIWIPKLFAVVPQLQKVILSPKSLFFLCNIIVMVLVRESRTVQEGKHVPDIYEEYTRRNVRRSIHDDVVSVAAGDDVNSLVVEGEELDEGYGGGGGEEEDEGYDGGRGGEEAEDEGYGSGGDEEEEEKELINRRVEEFIAKVNHQRRMEAKMLL